MAKKFAIYTLGCKVNQYESNAIQDDFMNNGYELVDFTEFADVYIINTCTVTGMSDKKSRQILRRAKQINPNAIVCAIGCYVQVAKEDVEKIKDVDIILGTIEKKDLLKKVEELLVEKKRIIEAENIMHLMPYSEYNGTAYTSHIRAEVKIQDGCDRFCTYCMIPYARGSVRSRKMENVIAEIEKLRDSGIKEVVITGIHVSSYGKDFNYEFGLIDLLEKINEIDGIDRIRLSSLEPRIITDEFVSRLIKLKKVCNHFHLSLQSGCDETLKRMNRKYTTDEFRNIVKLLRDRIPEVALTTDVIVGFPGETEEEFESTYKFLEEIKFSKMHVFKYSKRKGTPAETMPNQVPEQIKDERSKRLIEMSNKNEEEFARQYLGKEIEVLFENSKEGHTTNYIVYELETPDENVTNKIITRVPTKFINDRLE